MAEEDTTFESSAQDNTPEEDPLVKLGTDTPLGESVPMPDTTTPAAMAPVASPAVVAPKQEPANTNVPTFEEYAAEQQKSVPTFEEYSAQEQHPIGTAIHDRFQTDEGWTSFNPANRKLLESVSWDNVGKEASTAWEVIAKTGKAMGVALVPPEESHVDEENNKWLEDALGKEDFRKIKLDMNTSFTDIFFDATYNVGRSMEFLAAGTAYTAANAAIEFFEAPLRAWQAGSEVIGEEVNKSLGGALEAAPEVAMAVGLGMGHAIPSHAAKYAVPKPILKATAVGLFDDAAAGAKIPPERMKVIDEAHAASAEPLPLAVPVKSVEAHVQEVLTERGMPDLLPQRNRLEGQKEILVNSYAQLRDERNNAAEASSPYLELIQDNEKRLASAVEPKTKKMLQGRIDDLHDQHDAWVEEHTKEETPIMKAATAKLLDINDQLMTMASEGHIREAYKEAQKRMPAEVVAEAPKAEEGFIPATPFVPEAVAGIPLENGFFTGAYKGEKIRASSSKTLGSVMLEKRNGDRASAFHVMKDGNLVDAENVNLNKPDTLENLWKPESLEKQQAAMDILREMGELALEDPKRKVLKEKLKALVTGKEIPAAREIPAEVPVAPEVAIQKANIIAHATKKFTDAGRPLEEAQAIARITAEIYHRMASLFEGRKGTAEEMYHRESADVRSGEQAAAEDAAIKVAKREAAKKKAEAERDDVYDMARRKEGAAPKKAASAQGGLDVGKKGKKAKAGFTPIQNYLRKIGVKINDANEIVSGDKKLVASEFNNALEEHGIRHPGEDKTGEFVDHTWLSEQIANEKAGKGAMTAEQKIVADNAKQAEEIRGIIQSLDKDITKMTNAEIDAALAKYNEKFAETKKSPSRLALENDIQKVADKMEVGKLTDGQMAVIVDQHSRGMSFEDAISDMLDRIDANMERDAANAVHEDIPMWQGEGPAPSPQRMQLHQDSWGMTQFGDGEIALAGGLRTPTGRLMAGVERLKYAIYDISKLGPEKNWEAARVGEAEINVTLDEAGKITDNIEGLVNLKIDKKFREQGIGKKVMQSLLKNTDGKFHVYDVKKKAVGFWEKMGGERVSLPNRSDYIDMVIDTTKPELEQRIYDSDAPREVDKLFSPQKLANARNLKWGGSREILVYMHPQEFLDMAEHGVRADSTARVESMLDKGEVFGDIPNLSVDIFEGKPSKVTGHEGRHRARALLARGYDEMPVILKANEGSKDGNRTVRWHLKENESGHYTGEWPTELEAQDAEGGKKNKTKIPFPVEDLRNPDRLIEAPSADGKSMIPVMKSTGKVPDRMYRVMSRAEYDAGIKSGSFGPSKNFGRSHLSMKPQTWHAEPGTDNVLVEIQTTDLPLRAKYAGEELVATVSDPIPANLVTKVAEGSRKDLEGSLYQTTGTELMQSAWHGSPYRFDKFTLDNIGGGEGAQAYGHGLYFGGDKAVGEYYRKMLSNMATVEQLEKYFVPGKIVRGYSGKDKVISFQKKDEWSWSVTVEAVDKEGNKIPGERPRTHSTHPRADELKESGIEIGQTYEVEIPNDDMLINLDKKLSEQTGVTKDALEKIKEQFTENNSLGISESYIGAPFEEWTGKQLVLKGLPNADAGLGRAEAVSSFLNSLGIKGSKYLDQQSRTSGEGTHNYVIFDDAAIKIVNTLYQKGKGPPIGSFRAATKEAKALITLFKGHGVHTIIHESAHGWMELMHRLSEDIDAPQSLKDDVRILKEWSGLETIKAPTRFEINPKGRKVETKAFRKWESAQEKLARGIERYVLEGVAPKKELIPIFEKFRIWLTKAYESFPSPRDNLTPEVRAVFDRMMAHKAEDTVIAPEHEAGGMIAGVHEADVKTVPPEQKDTARDDIEKEAELTAQKHNAEIADGLTNADKIEEIPSEAEVPAEGVAGAGPTEGRQGTGKEPAQEPAGGGGARAGGAGVRAEPADGGPAESVGPHTALEPGESRYVDKAGNIRLDNLNAEEDAKQLFRDLAERNQDFMPQRGGVISDIRRREMADALGVTIENFDPRVPEGVSPSVWAETVQNVLFTALDDLTAKAKAFQESGTTENDVAFIQARQRFLIIAKQFSTMTAEAGRTLRVFDKGKLKFTQDVTALMQEETGMDLFQRQRQAKLFGQLDTQSKRAKAAQEGKKYTRLDKILGGTTEIRINFMLSNPVTHSKNIAGNTFIAVNSVIESALTTAVGTILRSEDRVGMNEAKARLFGIFQGAEDGIKVAGRLLKGEEDIQGAHTVETYAPFIPGKIGAGIRIPTKLLSAEDEIFKAIGYRQELNALAVRDANKMGLTGDAFERRVADLINDPSEEMIIEANKTAAYQSLTSPLGPTGRALQNFANSHFAVKQIFPFVRTPVNIAKYAGERTPFGLLSRSVLRDLAGENGTIIRDRAIARMAWGTTLSVLGIKWALSNIITGKGPTNPAERAQWIQEGNRPYSVRIGDLVYSYEWFDPLATILGVSADITEAYKSGIADNETWDKIGGMMLVSTGKNLTSKLSLRGASDLALVISDPDRYGDKYIESFVASFVPSALGHAARLSDPVQRETRNVLDAIKLKVPGLRKTLRPQIDVWGNDITDQGAFGPDVVSPIRMSAITNDPVNQRLLHLGIGIGKMKQEIHGVKLTDDQYDDFRRIAGKRTKIMLDKVISQPGFSQIPSVNQIKFIRSVVSAERKNASILIMQRYPEIMIQATENKRLELQR